LKTRTGVRVQGHTRSFDNAMSFGSQTNAPNDFLQ
jgi:hypothetical protein